MHELIKDKKWQGAAAPRTRRKASLRRLFVVLSIAACFLLWRELRSSHAVVPAELRRRDTPLNDSPISQKNGAAHARDFSLEKRSAHKIIRERPKMPKKVDSEPDQKPLEHLAEEGSAPDDMVQTGENSEQEDGSAPVVVAKTGKPISPAPPQAPEELRRGVNSAYESAQELVNNSPREKVSENVTPDEMDDGEETNLKGIAVAAKGKETVQQQLTSQSENSHAEMQASLDSTEYDKDYFPPYSRFLALDAKADTLPDVVHIPFEQSVADITLKGWEDKWFSDGYFNSSKWGSLEEPKIDFIYTWVNGSQKSFQDTIAPYELNSTLNDPDGNWLQHHRTNRYRDWDELRYSIRTIERHATTFRNKIQILVNAIGSELDVPATVTDGPAKIKGKQIPTWMDMKRRETKQNIEILAQEDFFGEEERGCLPTFNSLTIENQIYNTKSDTDRFYAMSDDMLLGKAHAASDLYSPLFGPTMGFKTNAYNTRDPPTDSDARRFGEKPYLIYTSWLLNRRFGERKRRGQVHFGHSMSRSVTREAINSFPRPALQSNCQRFRGETGFQLYSWYVTFHYTIERQREALLWSYIMQRSDTNQDGNLGWDERQVMIQELEEGMANEANTTFRSRIFYQVPEFLEIAGLEAPKVNLDILWTSLDGPSTIRDIECVEFNVNECMAPGFSVHSTDEHFTNPIFSAASIFDRVSRQHPKCGDCLIKLILNRQSQGLGPLLPHAETQSGARETAIKALLKYQYTIVEPDTLFMMVTDAQQVKNLLLRRLVNDNKEVGQLCLNDDVATDDPVAIENLRKTMKKFFKGFAPGRSVYELAGS